jgi:hypothetical protein
MHVRLLIALLLTILCMLSPTGATHCWIDGKIHWNASYKCCFGDAMGVWINKDCKVSVHLAYGQEKVERLLG